MDPASLTIGIFGLSTVLLATVRKLKETVQDVWYAKDDLTHVQDEMDLFAGTCDDFLDMCDEDPSISEHTTKLKLQLTSWTIKTIQGFETLLGKVQPVARDPRDNYNIVEVVTAHVVWLRSKGTLRYLCASLVVARQSMVCFTNIRFIEKLNRELAYLKSILSLTETERRRIEVGFNMTVEKRIAITQEKIRKRRKQRSKIKADLNETIQEATAHEKNIKDPEFIPQTKPLRQFRYSVTQYSNDVVDQERIDRRARRSDRSNSSITFQSAATTPTQSTQSSHHQASAPESPPTSPEPAEEDPRIHSTQSSHHQASAPESPPTSPELADEDPRIKYYEEAIDMMLEQCRRWKEMHEDVGAHIISIPPTPIEAASQTNLVVPPVVPPPPSKPERKIRRERASSCPQPNRIRLSSQSPTPRRHSPAERDVNTAEDANTRTFIDPVIPEEAEDASQDVTSEEEDPTEEQTRNAGLSIWQATGAFEGNMLRGLSSWRQRSRSPQDF